MRHYHNSKQLQQNNSSSRKSQSTKHLIKQPKRGSFLFLLTSAVFVTTPLFAYFTLFGNGADASVDTLVRGEEEEEIVGMEKEECPIYGCSLLPQDVYYDKKARFYLSMLRESSTGAAKDAAVDVEEEKKSEDETTPASLEKEEEIKEALSALQSSGRSDAATLTLIGYKGGAIESQINQDRAFVVSPYNLSGSDNKDGAATTTSRLLGVFDGHAKLGEGVSQHAVTQLPKLLSSKIQQEGDSSANIDESTIKQALHESFIEIDKTAPAHVSGGCTASVIFQHSDKLYIANAGDSRSFIASYIKPTKQVVIEYASREDKPHLEDEKKRVEEMGGRVYVPPEGSGGTSRVMYIDGNGNQYGLAMSRSLGDWEAGRLGVIPDPIVDVVKISDIIASHVNADGSCTVEEDGSSSCAAKISEADVKVFAVSATDGLIDYVSLEAIANHVAMGLFEEEGEGELHLLNACEDLIMAAAKGWHDHRGGRYRDDIAIAASVISS